MTSELITNVQQILGAAPAGCEPVEYMIAGALLLMLCMSAVSMISGIFRWIGGM